MPIRYFLLASTALAVASSGCAQGAPGEAAPSSDQVMIVFDASGSMWGQIDGKTKIEIAREALGTALKDVPAQSEIGMIAYGHRRKGDCADIEVMVPAKAGTGAAIQSKANGLNPRGKTPLSDAVRLAAKELRSTEQKATVVLLTDGLETCSADPCALGRELEESGVDFTAHVIGFGLTRDEGRQVSCLASETGGRYFETGNADELGEALGETVAASGEASEPVVSQPVPAVTLVAPDSVPIGTTFKVEWSLPEGPGEFDYIDIMETGTDRTHAEASFTYVEAGSPLDLRAPARAGAYNLRYISEDEGTRARRIAASRPLQVTPLDTFLSLPAKARAGEGVEVIWSGPNGEGDYVDVIEAGATRTNSEINYFYTKDGSPATLWMPVDVGVYDVRYVMEGPDGRVVKFTTQIEITPAQAALNAPASVTAGTDFNVEWEGPASPYDYIDLVPAGYAETSGELTYHYTRDGATAVLRAPTEPGAYEVRYVLEGDNAGRRILASRTVTVR